MTTKSPTQAELQEQFFNSMEQAVKQELTYEQIIENIRVELQELVGFAAHVTTALAQVGNFAPFFNFDFINKEGVTDVSKIDQSYMLQIGRQLLNDYTVFSSEANALSTQMKELCDTFMATELPNEDFLTQTSSTAMLIQTQYVDWSERYQRIITSAMQDIANHLNPLRPADRQIIVG